MNTWKTYRPLKAAPIGPECLKLTAQLQAQMRPVWWNLSATATNIFMVFTFPTNWWMDVGTQQPRRTATALIMKWNEHVSGHRFTQSLKNKSVWYNVTASDAEKVEYLTCKFTFIGFISYVYHHWHFWRRLFQWSRPLEAWDSSEGRMIQSDKQKIFTTLFLGYGRCQHKIDPTKDKYDQIYAGDVTNGNWQTIFVLPIHANQCMNNP